MTKGMSNVCVTNIAWINEMIQISKVAVVPMWSHNTFAIPVSCEKDMLCHIKKIPHKAKLMRKVWLIIWDQVPMQSWMICEIVDRTLRALLDKEKCILWMNSSCMGRWLLANFTSGTMWLGGTDYWRMSWPMVTLLLKRTCVLIRVSLTGENSLSGFWCRLWQRFYDLAWLFGLMRFQVQIYCQIDCCQR